MVKKILLSVVLVIISIPLIALADENLQAITKRIKPVGQVNVSGSNSAVKTIKVTPKSTKKAGGEAVYSKYCAVCHTSGVAGAPKMGDVTAWQSRLKQRKGVGGLVKQAKKGLNAMPPMGTCSSCSDAELEAAIKYMLPKKS